MKRNRYATRDELISLVVEQVGAVATPDSVIDRLAELGAPIDALVKITVEEPIE